MQNFDKVIFMDTETTGVDNETDQVIEVSAILYNIGTQKVEMEITTLINPGVDIPEDVSVITGIWDDSVEAVDRSNFMLFMGAFKLMESQARCIIAYNADFDKGFFNRTGTDRTPNEISLKTDLPWICAMKDIEWMPKGGRQPLGLLALNLGLAVDGSQSHGARFDAYLMVRLFNLRWPSLNQEAIERAFLPKVTYKALVSYERNSLAKAEGFQWNPASKSWLKEIREGEEDQFEDLDFKVVKF